MKIYVINLRRRPERMAFMTQQFSELGLSFERIEAVDGALMSNEEKDSAIDRFRWWCAKGYEIRPGELGCALSHLATYRRIVDAGLDCACVLEDDATLEKGFIDALEVCGEFLRSGSPKVVLLTRHKNGNGKERFERVRWDTSTGGYVISQTAAKAILAANTPVMTISDDWGRWVRRGLIELYDYWPEVCIQEPYGSTPADHAFASDTIGEDAVFVKDMPLFRKIWHKMKRAVGCTLDRLLP